MSAFRKYETKKSQNDNFPSYCRLRKMDTPQQPNKKKCSVKVRSWKIGGCDISFAAIGLIKA